METISVRDKKLKTAAEIANKVWAGYNTKKPNTGFLNMVGFEFIWAARYFSGKEKSFSKLEAKIFNRMLAKSSKQTNQNLSVPTIDPKSFDQNTLNTLFSCDFPIVIKGLLKNSKASKTWSLDELSKRFGNSMVSTLEQKISKQNYSEPHYHSHVSGEMQIKDLVNSVRNGERKYAIATSAFFEDKQELFDEVGFNTLEKVFNKEIMRPEIFIGSKQNASYYHCSAGANIFCQVHGVKKWTFVAPWHTSFIYPNLGHSHKGTYFGSPIITEFQEKEPNKYPLYNNIPTYQVKLEPGDVLVNPPWWWHEVINEGETIGIAHRVARAGGAHASSLLFNTLVLFSPFVQQRIRETIKSKFGKNKKRYIDFDDDAVKTTIHNKEHTNNQQN